MPPSRRFDDVHPLGRALLAISAPIVVLAIALAVLGPRGVVESAQALAHHLAAGPISTVRAFVDRFSTTAGSVRAGAQLALALAAINLLPLPIVPGGMALTYVLQWLTGKAKVRFRNRP